MRVVVIRSPELTPALVSATRRAGLSPLLRACGERLGIGARSLVVRLTDDAELRRLNAQFLGTDEPTDVLAFPADEPGHVGDIAISVERAVAQTTAAGGRPEEEMRLLAVHGLLHCLGHDHAEAADADAMTALTRQLLPGQDVPALVGHR